MIFPLVKTEEGEKQEGGEEEGKSGLVLITISFLWLNFDFYRIPRK